MQHLVRGSNLAIVLALASVSLAWLGDARAQFRPPLRVAQQLAPGGQPSAPQPGGAAGPSADNGDWHGAPQIVPARPPRQPFVLTPEQEKELTDVLNKWEEKGDKIKSFKCNFSRWDYDTAFGDPNSSFLKSEGEGELKFWAPDHGKYRLVKARDRVSKGDKQPFEWKPRDATDLDHWVCDGESIFEVKAVDKQLIQHKLPKELRGKAITDGPLPFVFGAKADQIKRRYFIRLVTPPDEKGKHVWLEAWPKFQADAGNYQRVTISLTEPDFVPHALQVFLPGSPLPGTPLANGGKTGDNSCSRTVYLFESPLINDKLGFVKFDWLPPWVPPTWKKVVEEAPDEQPPAAAAASNPPASHKAAPAPPPQANRNPPPPLRR